MIWYFSKVYFEVTASPTTHSCDWLYEHDTDDLSECFNARDGPAYTRYKLYILLYNIRNTLQRDHPAPAQIHV